MKADDSAVAGFFEDLPVLAFVLAGATVLILTSSWVAACEQGRRSVEELERLAEEVSGRLLDEIGASDPAALAPTIASVGDIGISNVSRNLPEWICISVSIIELYPDARWLFGWSSTGASEAISTGAESVLFSVREIDGNLAVAEMRVIVWSSR